MSKSEILHRLLQYGTLEYEWLKDACSLDAGQACEVIADFRARRIEILETPDGFLLKEGQDLSPYIISAIFSSLCEDAGDSVKGAKLTDIPIFVLGTTESTNLDARRYAEEHPEVACALFVAEGQTAGRGRLGRSFLSNEGVGLYFSLLLRGVGEATDALSLTTYSAVALCRALRSVASIEPKIKWVNDIYVGDKKLAGILTEGRLSSKGDGRLDYAIIGIGVNVGGQDFGELSSIATDIESECGHRPNRSLLAGELLFELTQNLDRAGTREAEEEYASLSMLSGKRVRVITPTGEYPATVLGIAEGCTLRVRLDTGEEKTLFTGEVSLRLDN